MRGNRIFYLQTAFTLDSFGFTDKHGADSSRQCYAPPRDYFKGGLISLRQMAYQFFLQSLVFQIMQKHLFRQHHSYAAAECLVFYPLARIGINTGTGAHFRRLALPRQGLVTVFVEYIHADFDAWLVFVDANQAVIPEQVGAGLSENLTDGEKLGDYFRVGWGNFKDLVAEKLGHGFLADRWLREAAYICDFSCINFRIEIVTRCQV